MIIHSFIFCVCVCDKKKKTVMQKQELCMPVQLILKKKKINKKILTLDSPLCIFLIKML